VCESLWWLAFHQDLIFSVEALCVYRCTEKPV
jgi:hypothetical protein